MTILTDSIDLAKNVFAVHGTNEAGKAELVRPAVALREPSVTYCLTSGEALVVRRKGPATGRSP